MSTSIPPTAAANRVERTLDAIIRSFEAETTAERWKQQQEAVRIWHEGYNAALADVRKAMKGKE